MATTTSRIPAGILEHDGMLWKPRRGATTSSEEFIAARALFIQLNDDATWNPWIRDERAADIDAAAEVMGQWQRAEPGHRRMSVKQWEAQQARRERQREHQRAKDQARRERDKARYDEERSIARLRLIELQSSLDHGLTEVAGLREGTSFPAMDPKRRSSEIQDLENKVAGLNAEVDRLTPIVGDLEDVVDEHGWLPRDRREQTWWTYRLDRERKVRDLKQRLPELEATLKSTSDRGERRDHRATLAQATRDLDRLIAQGPFTAADMCSECATPMAHHGWVWPPGRPCPAWPGWAERMRESRQMLETFTKSRDTGAAPPATAKPQPLAVVPSGLSIAEVVVKLTELQELFPGAEVRRGRANRWELWNPDA
jgi:hypothetical protein